MRITLALITALFALAFALVPAFAQLVERRDLSYAIALDIATGALDRLRLAPL